jgi:predicted nucleic acid-binding protein
VYLLDTNVLSEITRKTPDVAVIRRLHAISPSNLLASEITRHELRFGAVLRPQGEVLGRRIEQEIVPLVIWLPIEERVSLRAADVRAALAKSGKMIDAQDAFIAATALAHDLVLVTRNVRHFANVAGLATENWWTAT